MAAETKTVTETTTEQTEPKKTAPKKTAEKKTENYKVTVPVLNIREKASLNAEVLDTIKEGETVEITSRTPQGFGKLADREGYVKLDFVEKVEE